MNKSQEPGYYYLRVPAEWLTFHSPASGNSTDTSTSSGTSISSSLFSQIVTDNRAANIGIGGSHSVKRLSSVVNDPNRTWEETSVDVETIGKSQLSEFEILAEKLRVKIDYSSNSRSVNYGSSEHSQDFLGSFDQKQQDDISNFEENRSSFLDPNRTYEDPIIESRISQVSDYNYTRRPPSQNIYPKDFSELIGYLPREQTNQKFEKDSGSPLESMQRQIDPSLNIEKPQDDQYGLPSSYRQSDFTQHVEQTILSSDSVQQRSCTNQNDSSTNNSPTSTSTASAGTSTASTDMSTRVVKKRGRKPIDKSQFYCRHCNTRDTPEWRRGPLGLNTLCNKCGLLYAKRLKQHKQRKGKNHFSFILNP